MTPRVIHFIFFGFTEFQIVHYLAVKSALAVHQVPVRLHYSQAPINNPLWDEIAGQVELVHVIPPESFEGVPLTSYQYKADILRLQVLLEQGGAYLDIDVISLRPFGDLWDEQCVLGLENREGTSVTNAVILSRPGHPYIQKWLDETGKNLQDRPWAWHGVCLPWEIYSQQPWPNVRLEPRSSFMPFDFREPYIFTDDPAGALAVCNSYTMHMWDTIWNQQLSQIDHEYFYQHDNHFTRICKPYLARKIMPTSSDRGKNWIRQQLRRMTDRVPVRNILDIGAGAGTYHNQFGQMFPDAEWTGIEVWQPYVEQYGLEQKYHAIIRQDAREVAYHSMGCRYDLVFAGDVLEHMTKTQAQDLVDRLLDNHACVMISVPVVYMPQDEYEGNPYERHVKDDWSDQEFRETFGTDIVTGAVDCEIGTYLLSRDAEFVRQFRRLRIAVYTICKNEQKNVHDWAASNQEADYRLVCDTGSDDDTRSLLSQHNINVVPISVIPWRFDVARETSLNLLPPDIDVCIWQDLDERLLPGWREQLEQHWTPETTTANHRYRNNGRPWQWHSKIHARHNCRWTGAVHETLAWEIPEHTVWIPELYLDEHQDLTKSRGSYIHLLEQKIREGDRNWRTYSFYSNELAAAGRVQDCIEQRKKAYDACNEGSIIQSHVARTIAEAYSVLGDHAQTESWFQTAVNHSNERETWYAWAKYCYSRQDWLGCYFRAQRAISVTDRRDGFTYDPAAWDHALYDMAAQSAYRCGFNSQAADLGNQALSTAPNDDRLQHNQAFYDEAAPVPVPDVLTIETSSNCNRTCGTCMRNSDPDRERVASWFQDNLMSMDTIRKIMEDARSMGFRRDLCLSFYNEPTMDPRLADIVDLARTYPFRNIFMHSNGDFMTPELAARLDGKLTWIYFSIYADEPARTRRQQDLKSWFKQTEIRFSNSLHGLTHYGPAQNLDTITGAARGLPCAEPTDRFIINHRGEMTMCCDDMGGNFDLGNVNDKCLWDLWFDPRHQKLVRQLQRPGGRAGLPHCENCPRPHQQNFTVKNTSL